MTEDSDERIVDQIELLAIERMAEVLGLLVGQVTEYGGCSKCSGAIVAQTVMVKLLAHRIWRTGTQQSREDFINEHSSAIILDLGEAYDEATNNQSSDPAPTHAGPGTTQ